MSRLLASSRACPPSGCDARIAIGDRAERAANVHGAPAGRYAREVRDPPGLATLAVALGAAAGCAPTRRRGPRGRRRRVLVLAALTPRGRARSRQCGPGEARLREDGARVVARKRAGQPLPELDGISFAQRRAGEPHLWPRAWAGERARARRGAALPHARAWRDGATSRPAAGRRWERRRGDGTGSLVAVAVDALADLAPLPMRARAGQWLAVEARMRVPATSASVVVLGPSGAPRAVLTSSRRHDVRARFAPDRPGAFTVQVVADLAAGPRPVLEARRSPTSIRPTRCRTGRAGRVRGGGAREAASRSSG